MAEKLFIHDRTLREVCDLCRPAKIGDGWEQIILHDGTKQDVGAEVLRVLIDFAQEILPRNALRPDYETAVRALDEGPLAAFEAKEKG